MFNIYYMIKNYESFFTDLFAKKDNSYKIENFFEIASDINDILYEISDSMEVDSEFSFFCLAGDSDFTGTFKLEIENGKFISPLRDLKFCGFNDMSDFIQKIKNNKFTFFIQFLKKTDLDKKGRSASPVGTSGKLTPSEMKIINSVGERIKNVAGFKKYKLYKKDSALHPITVWDMSFSF